MNEVSKKPILSYDESDILEVEAKYRFEEDNEEGLTLEACREDAEESIDYQMYWDDFCESIGDLCNKRFKTGYVRVTATDVGWRGLRGTKYVDINTAWTKDTQELHEKKGEALLNGILPRCDNTITVYSYKEGKGLLIVAKNHDNPLNGDHFYVTGCAQSTYERCS